ncbi:MAG: hypothetical protein HY525_00295, partial [Betaproteobacteria bacterium]|nr:hypothetical protein [Betaproteobacteria bacterium]
FALLGIDSDNGSEFINNHLLRYCQQENITFTRGRAWKKNDGCFVEQKNYSVVRRAVGYARYDSATQQRLLNTLYAHLRLYTNYFQPVMKLVSKQRLGAKVKKTYDRPQTPYRRLLAAPGIAQPMRQRLQAEYATLNPAQLKREITRLQDLLRKTAVRRQRSTFIDSLPCLQNFRAQLLRGPTSRTALHPRRVFDIRGAYPACKGTSYDLRELERGCSSLKAESLGQIRVHPNGNVITNFRRRTWRTAGRRPHTISGFSSECRVRCGPHCR